MVMTYEFDIMYLENMSVGLLNIDDKELFSFFVIACCLLGNRVIKSYFLNSESFSACVEKWPLKPHFLDYSKS